VRPGEDRFSALGVPFVVIGSTLFAFLPGMEFAPLAAAEAGATTTQIEATQEALAAWFLPVLMTGALAFAIGMLAFARAISIVTVGSRALTRVVVVALHRHGRIAFGSPGRSAVLRAGCCSHSCALAAGLCDANASPVRHRPRATLAEQLTPSPSRFRVPRFPRMVHRLGSAPAGHSQHGHRRHLRHRIAG
jgi:hypothetical protein